MTARFAGPSLPWQHNHKLRGELCCCCGALAVAFLGFVGFLNGVRMTRCDNEINHWDKYGISSIF